MEANAILRFCFVFYVVTLGSGAAELLLNNNFESVSYHGNWYCAGGCSLSADMDSYEGSHSVKVSNR